MDHLAQDLSVALEESESCGAMILDGGRKWGIRRRTRSAGNLRVLGMSLSLESDSFNEHSPARPNLRRKRKLKRMSIDETPIPPCGKRKRPQRFEMIDNNRGFGQKIKPLHQSVVDKIEKFCQTVEINDCNQMETQYIDDNCDVASESSLSWSGGEGHEGDDELTDWAPTQDNNSSLDQSWNDDQREIRAGCRRLREERPGFSISTGANERVAKFLQDSNRSELRLFGAEHEKLGQLASLYSLDHWFDGSSSLLKKTSRTPCMQPTQRHHNGHNAAHKKIRTQDRGII
ncbi:uncharacterized protein [Onthophagus taurus]|uniref:uncharacterized protein isoform X3 n=1 Tax=Onthophagus taurus TaxID=166361 RepID=UPI0039BE6533